MKSILNSAFFTLLALLGTGTLVAKYYEEDAEKELVSPLVALDVVEVSHLTFMREEKNSQVMCT